MSETRWISKKNRGPTSDLQLATDEPHLVEAVAENLLRDRSERIVACCNACAGIPDPGAFVRSAMRLLRRYRSETPLGHQPHMIAAEVDEFLARHGQGGGE